MKEHLRSAYLLSDEKIESVLPVFLETVKTLMTELECLACEGKNDALCRTGHAMKGALLNLGLNRLAAKACDIEQHVKNCNSGKDCRQLVAELKQEINKMT